MGVEPLDLAVVREVQSAWDDALGTPLIPEGLQLLSLCSKGNRLEVQTSDARGVRFGFSVEVPDGLAFGASTETGTFKNWAVWEVIVPLAEEIETDAAHRVSPDAAGIRWVSAT